MKHILLYTSLLFSPLLAAPVAVGPNGEGVNPTPFLNALGGSTAGKALFQMANPGAVRYIRLNADNTVSQLDAASFLSAIGGGGGGGTASTTTSTATGTVAATNVQAAIAELESEKVNTSSLSTTGGANKVLQFDGSGNTAAITKTMVGLGSVDNTSDAQKVSAGLARLLSATIVSKTGIRTEYIASADTDAARGAALTNAILAVTSGQTLICSPGDYYMATTNLLLVGSVSYIWNGARLYIDGSSTGRVGGEGGLAGSLFTSGFSTAPLYVSNWSFIGPLILDGGSVASKRGMFPIGSGGCLVQGVTFKNWADTGFLPYGSTSKGNRISDCYFVSNTGTGALFNAEYWVISNCHASGNGTGFDASAGNLYFSNCSSSFNTSYGLKIMNTANGGHGSWVGGSINHHESGSIGVYIDPALVTFGFSFTGVMFYNTTFDVNGYGIEVIGGDVKDTSIICSGGTPTYTSHFRYCKTLSSSTTFAAGLAALTSAKRAKLKIVGWRDESGALPTFCDAGEFVPQSYTTTARDALTGVTGGTIIRNTTTSKLNFYTGSAWEAVTSAP
jgi:hypothetical protein